MKAKNIKKNYKTIIGVTALAFFLWFMVKMNKVYEYTIDIPIRYINMDPDRIFEHPESPRVRVEFTGKGKDLLRLSFYHIYYQVDLSDAPMRLTLNLSEHPEYVNYPGELDVDVKSIIRPRELVVVMDKKVQKKLPVESLYRVQTPPGYILVDVSTKPDSILVTGPQKMFKTLKKVSTVKKDFPDASQPFTKVLPIEKTNDYYSFYKPTEVQLYFNIQRLAEKEVLNVPVTVINAPRSIQVIPLPSAATVYVKGGEKVLANLGPNDFRIEIDFKKVWTPGVKTVKANLVTSANILYMETRPPEFELIVQKEKSD